MVAKITSDLICSQILPLLLTMGKMSKKYIKKTFTWEFVQLMKES